jgi:NAD(P)-dependent dehydrogenase (short-subunit alcohol dehydrogenase family)
VSDYLGYAGKRVVVTGCFSGMGEATARLLIEQGAEVHGFDYKDSALPLASFTNVDLRDPGSIDAAVDGLGGTVDALFNCAGLPQTFPAMDVMKVNFIGTRHLTQRIMALMPSGGAVASIASTGGLGWSRRIPTHMEFFANADFGSALAWCEANPETVSEGYAFSKEAVIVWTMVESFTAIAKGIRVNCLLPGPTQTPMMTDHFEKVSAAAVDWATQPINRRSTPDEQARPLAFLNSAAASYVNGVVLPADGGFMAGLATGKIDLSALQRKPEAA